MGMDNFRRKKAARTDRRFLGSIRGNISVDDGRFSLERFHDCSFFNQQKSKCGNDSVDDDDNDDDEPKEAVEERIIYWESQEFLLQEILEQYNSIGSKLREQITRQIEMIGRESICDKNLLGRSCIKCLRRAAVSELCSKGFSASLCMSQWKTTRKTPGGSHEYIQVIASTQGRRKQIPFLVELGFRDEFRMAKASDEYNNLVNQLPEIYIGKSEHLNAMIRLVCEAAKKSTEELNIHMGPWRKRSFMQMKWSASSITDQSRFHHHHHHQYSSVVITAPSSFQLPMAATVRVA